MARRQDWTDSKWALPALAFLFLFVSGVLDVAYKSLDYVTNGYPHQLKVIVMEEATGRVAAVLIVPLALMFFRRFPLRRERLGASIPIHLGMSMLFSLVATSVNWGSRSLLSPWLGLGAYDYGNMKVRYFMEYPRFLLYYAFILTLLTLWEWHKARTQLEAQLAQAQLHNLRLQLQPHFLFNALNTISSVMYDDPRVADEMIARLSDLLRRTLSESPAQEVPLEQEIETLDLYLRIMQARFEDRLRVDWNVETGAEAALVPQLILQPLVENSIRHGVDPHSSRIEIAVSARREGDMLSLEVRDKGRGLSISDDKALDKGIGLSNTRKRLEGLYGTRQRLELANQPSGGLAVKILLPFHA